MALTLNLLALSWHLSVYRGLPSWDNQKLFEASAWCHCGFPSGNQVCASLSSHRVEEQRAVLSITLCSCEDSRERHQRALWQGTTSSLVIGDNILVQTQLSRDAFKGLRVQIQDGDSVGERRWSGGVEVPEAPLTGHTEGRKEYTSTGWGYGLTW